MNRIVFIFVDGLGLGDPDSPDNPLGDSGLDLLANHRPAAWTPPPGGGRPESLPEVCRERALPHAGIVRATDASLGVPGLPQSATGQTTILTGENGALALGGRHYNGYPTRTLRSVIERASVFRRLRDAGRPATFLNAFSPRFFDLGEDVWTKRLSATTWAARAGGHRFLDFADLRAGRAVFFDITHDSEYSRESGLPPRSPESAADALAAAARIHAFTLFEFFLTDKAGHARDRGRAVHEIAKLERFLAAVLDRLDLGETALVVTSDHGNVEDLGVKTHTVNPVPTLAFGAGAADLARRIDRLEAFAPAVLAALGADFHADGTGTGGAEGTESPSLR